MTIPKARLAFFKLNVDPIESALAFWHQAFGFEIAGTFDEPEFLEHILALPGQEDGPNLMLVETKSARDVSIGPGHGPVGLVCEDVAASFARALDHGATSMLEPFAAAGVQVAMLRSPQGHEVELVQLPTS